MIYHVPNKDKWEFDESVTDIFEDMLSRSIPQYEVMRKAVTNIASEFISNGGHVIDIGCSRGEQISRLIGSFGNECHYHGIECSQPMIDVCSDKFKDFRNVKLYNIDLRKEWIEIKNTSVCLSILTLQFIPIEYRLSLLKKIYDSTKVGGCLIVVEKVIGGSAKIDELTTEQYYNLKHQNGYSVYEIERKRLSLEGVLVPVTAKWNEEMIRLSGFSEVDCFWRWMNFAGWIAIK
jgi:tRNA (cmo5U34)-methyltransferase